MGFFCEGWIGFFFFCIDGVLFFFVLDGASCSGSLCFLGLAKRNL